MYYERLARPLPNPSKAPSKALEGGGLSVRSYHRAKADARARPSAQRIREATAHGLGHCDYVPFDP